MFIILELGNMNDKLIHKYLNHDIGRNNMISIITLRC